MHEYVWKCNGWVNLYVCEINSRFSAMYIVYTIDIYTKQ